MSIFPTNNGNTPFVWGSGGRRMTPEQIAFEQRLAAGDMQADYSPIQSPWQGLARVAQNLTGALRYRNANKAADANADYSRQIIEALTGGGASSDAAGAATDPSQPPGAPSSAPGGVNPAVIEALSSPYVSDEVRQFAQQQFKRAQPIEVNGKLVDPTTMQVLGDFSSEPEIVRLARVANDPSSPEWARAAAKDRIQALNDPFTVIPFPGGTFAGPRSYLPSVVGGGGPASAAPGGAMPPATLPPDFDFGDGGPTPGASGGFPDPMSAPGTMTSGRRTPEGNRLVGGVPHSAHLTGDAADYVGTSMQALRDYFGPSARLLDEGDHIHATLPGYHRVPYFGRRGTVGAR